MGAPPLLVTVSVAGALATPTDCTGKFKLGGDTVMVGGNSPVPESGTFWVWMRSETISVPDWTPAAVGAKTTLMEQLDWAANWVPQLVETWKAPLAEAAMEVRARSPLLARVTV